MYTNVEQRIKRIAWLLDSSIKLPGGFRIGLESVIGLVPGIGDSIGALLSSYIIYVAAKDGAPKAVLLKMIYNVALETLIGVIPVAGDIFDMVYKANMRNVELLEVYSKSSKRALRSNKRLAAIVLLLLIIVIGLLIWLTILFIGLLIDLFSQFG